MQTSVVMVKPAGTGMPRLTISARFAPLPPSRLRMLRSPSATFPPKKYTIFLADIVILLLSLYERVGQNRSPPVQTMPSYCFGDQARFSSNFSLSRAKDRPHDQRRRPPLA